MAWVGVCNIWGPFTVRRSHTAFAALALAPTAPFLQEHVWSSAHEITPFSVSVRDATTSSIDQYAHKKGNKSSVLCFAVFQRRFYATTQSLFEGFTTLFLGCDK